MTTHGTPLAPGPGSANVIIGFMPAWRAMTDQHACPMVNVTGPDGIGSVMMGSPTVFINNMMACRMGDIVIEKPGLALGPANPIILGCPTVIIGDVGNGGTGPGLGLAMSAAKSQGASHVQPEQATNVVPGEPPHLDWIGIKLVNELGEPYSEQELHGQTTDGKQHQREVSSGLHFSEIPPGSCTFNFPKLYDDMKNWKPDADE